MKYQYWLANIKGMTGSKINLLLTHFGSAEEIYFVSEAQLLTLKGLSGEDVHTIIESKKSWDIDGEFWKLTELGVGFVTIDQEEYPKRLKTIPRAPYALYYKGGLPKEEQRAVAIVGARNCSEYGRGIARELGRQLAEGGIAVVSGMARGIDGAGHQGALDGGGRTYAVLGCGVDVCYPRENRELYENIPQKGGILSEYPPKSPALAVQFPKRNRIISGLCSCVVVIEAKKKSGSLITADFAMEQGRDVFAVPGRITDELSGGCNRLISQGAGILSDIGEFLRDYAMLSDMQNVQLDFRKNLLEKDETLVYSLLDFCPVGIGTLLDKTSFQLYELLGILERLKQKGFVRETVPNYYVQVF